jgi:hypothetical protein
LFLTKDKGPGQGQLVGIKSSGSVASPVDVNTMCESPNAKFGILPPGIGKMVLNHNWKQQSDFYSKKHDGMTAQFGQNPAELAYFL